MGCDVVCHKGRCFEMDVERRFSEVFDRKNVVEMIQHDLLMEML